MLLKKPRFTVIATPSLALGIGAKTVIFSLIDSSLPRPLPYPDASRLVMVWSVPLNQPNRPIASPTTTTWHSKRRSRLNPWGPSGVNRAAWERMKTANPPSSWKAKALPPRCSRRRGSNEEVTHADKCGQPVKARLGPPTNSLPATWMNCVRARGMLSSSLKAWSP